ncbi:Cathepsin_B [Hexamita inflata]|uniref:Cathepsin B n=1 Tax=Hexamita inflata TaxID=28002 RepID=A0AA86UQS3_9EUKA|nr:Cathepsin B [Hexamita inflata]CAI9967976.1 Cathepsin B [Hexamita inflata]
MIILAAVLQVDFLNEETLELLKNIPDMTWTPTIHAIFVGKSEEDILRMVGNTQINLEYDQPDMVGKEVVMETNEVLEKAVIPDSFSWFEQKPECLLVRDVNTCYAHWAFAAMGVFSDNRCIRGRDPVRVTYSEQFYLSCNYYSADRCTSGNISYPVWFMRYTGATTEACVKYKNQWQNWWTPSQGRICPDKCDDGSVIPLVKITLDKQINFDACDNSRNNMTKEDMMKQHIFTYGSLLGIFDVYNDFLYYSFGIYQHVKGSFIGKQPIIIVGYGEESGVKYWIVRGDRGVIWGESGDHDPEKYDTDEVGYFRILRGTNHCNIEERCTVFDL